MFSFKNNACIILLFLFFSQQLYSQNLVLPDKAFVKSGFADIGVISKSIIHPSDQQLFIGFTASAAIINIMAFDKEIKQFAQKNVSTSSNQITKYLEPCGRGSIAIGVLASTYLVGVFTKNEQTQRKAMIGAKAFLIGSGLLVGGLKYTTQRQRPFSTDNPLNFHSILNTRNYESFPSGHSADAFMLATFLNSFIKNKWLHIPLYTLAGAVAVSRVHDNKHWASDIILGSLIGYATTKALLKANTWQAPSKYLIKNKF